MSAIAADDPRLAETEKQDTIFPLSANCDSRYPTNDPHVDDNPIPRSAQEVQNSEILYSEKANKMAAIIVLVRLSTKTVIGPNKLERIMATNRKVVKVIQ